MQTPRYKWIFPQLSSVKHLSSLSVFLISLKVLHEPSNNGIGSYYRITLVRLSHLNTLNMSDLIHDCQYHYYHFYISLSLQYLLDMGLVKGNYYDGVLLKVTWLWTVSIICGLITLLSHLPSTCSPPDLSASLPPSFPLSFLPCEFKCIPLGFSLATYHWQDVQNACGGGLLSSVNSCLCETHFDMQYKKESLWRLFLHFNYFLCSNPVPTAIKEGMCLICQ